MRAATPMILAGLVCAGESVGLFSRASESNWLEFANRGEETHA